MNAANPTTEAVRIPCPACREATDSLKRYTMPHFVLFLGIGAGAQHATYTSCPPCMRMKIVERALVNLLPANFAMIVLLPVYAIHFARTFARGHSEQVEAVLRSAAAAQRS